MKSKRQILLSDLIPSAPTSKIYINERSTAIERKTLFKARDYAKTHHYKYCWMTKGRIYMRKNYGAVCEKYPRNFDIESDDVDLNATLLQVPPS